MPEPSNLTAEQLNAILAQGGSGGQDKRFQYDTKGRPSSVVPIEQMFGGDQALLGQPKAAFSPDQISQHAAAGGELSVAQATWDLDNPQEPSYWEQLQNDPISGPYASIVGSMAQGATHFVQNTANLAGQALHGDAFGEIPLSDFHLKGPVAPLASAITDFSLGFAAGGPVVRALSAGTKLAAAGKVAQLARSTAQGAFSDFVGMDPHQERLAGLLTASDNSLLNNTVSQFFADKHEDNDILGRMANMLEGGMVGLGTHGLVSGAASVYKALTGIRASRAITRALEAGKAEEAKKVAEATAKRMEILSQADPRIAAGDISPATLEAITNPHTAGTLEEIKAAFEADLTQIGQEVKGRFGPGDVGAEAVGPKLTKQVQKSVGQGIKEGDAAAAISEAPTHPSGEVQVYNPDSPGTPLSVDPSAVPADVQQAVGNSLNRSDRIRNIKNWFRDFANSGQMTEDNAARLAAGEAPVEPTAIHIQASEAPPAGAPKDPWAVVVATDTKAARTARYFPEQVKPPAAASTSAQGSANPVSTKAPAASAAPSTGAPTASGTAPARPAIPSPGPAQVQLVASRIADQVRAGNTIDKASEDAFQFHTNLAHYVGDGNVKLALKTASEIGDAVRTDLGPRPPEVVLKDAEAFLEQPGALTSLKVTADQIQKLDSQMTALRILRSQAAVSSVRAAESGTDEELMAAVRMSMMLDPIQKSVQMNVARGLASHNIDLGLGDALREVEAAYIDGIVSREVSAGERAMEAAQKAGGTPPAPAAAPAKAAPAAPAQAGATAPTAAPAAVKSQPKASAAVSAAVQQAQQNGNAVQAALQNPTTAPRIRFIIKNAQGNLRTQQRVIRWINSTGDNFVTKLANMSLEYTRGMLISAATTQGNNFVSSGMNGYFMPIERMVGSFRNMVKPYSVADRGEAVAQFGQAARLLKNTLVEQVDALKSFVYMKQNWSTWEAMKDTWKTGVSSLDPYSTAHSMTGGNLTSAYAGISPKGLGGKALDTLGKSIGYIAFKPNQFFDEFFKQTTFRAQLRTEGEALYTKMFGNQPFNAAHYDQYMQHYIDSAFDPASHAAIVGRPDLDEALTYAERVTFSNPLPEGSIGSGIQRLLSGHPILQMTVMPFVRIPSNIIGQAIDLTPAVRRLHAFAPGSDFNDRLLNQSVGIRQEALGQIWVGRALAGSTIAMTLSGTMTGHGPANPEERKAWLAAGNVPYSFKIPGTNTSVSYQRFGPPGMMMGVISDLVSNFENFKSENDFKKALWETILQTGKNVTDQTYLTGLNQFLQVLEGGDNAATKFLGDKMGMFFPRLASTLPEDEYQRQVKTVSDGFLKQIPYVRASLPPVRDPVFGTPIQTYPSRAPYWKGISYINPYQVVDSNPDPVAVEMAKLQYGWGPPPQKFKNVDLRYVNDGNKQDAYDRWQQLQGEVKIGGKTLRDRMEKMLDSAEYNKLAPPSHHQDSMNGRVIMVNNLISKYRDAAFASMIKEYPSIKDAAKTNIIESIKGREKDTVLEKILGR